MRVIIAAGLLGAAVGAAVGWMNAADYYETKARKDQAAYYEAIAKVAERSDHYKTISEEYYADYQDAINREPTVITNRVLVRAHCKTDAAADTGRELGNGAEAERVELHAETVRSAAAVTDQAERDVLSCRAALHSLQRKIKAHNELQR